MVTAKKRARANPLIPVGRVCSTQYWLRTKTFLIDVSMILERDVGHAWVSRYLFTMSRSECTRIWSHQTRCYDATWMKDLKAGYEINFKKTRFDSHELCIIVISDFDYSRISAMIRWIRSRICICAIQGFVTGGMKGCRCWMSWFQRRWTLHIELEHEDTTKDQEELAMNANYGSAGVKGRSHATIVCSKDDVGCFIIHQWLTDNEQNAFSR